MFNKELKAEIRTLKAEVDWLKSCVKNLNVWKWKQENPPKFKADDCVNLFDIEVIYDPSICNSYSTKKVYWGGNPYRIIKVEFYENSYWRYKCINKEYDIIDIKENNIELCKKENKQVKKTINKHRRENK